MLIQIHNSHTALIILCCVLWYDMPYYMLVLHCITYLYNTARTALYCTVLHCHACSAWWYMAQWGMTSCHIHVYNIAACCNVIHDDLIIMTWHQLGGWVENDDDRSYPTMYTYTEVYSQANQAGRATQGRPARLMNEKGPMHIYTYNIYRCTYTS